MNINILVRPVYERQRAQLTDISNPNVNHAWPWESVRRYI
jgi:hypothetical protein